MHRRIRKSPADGWRLVGVRWRHHGALWDVELGLGSRELMIAWERYGEAGAMPPKRAEQWWYWVIVLAMLLGCAWLVAGGRP